MKGCPVKGFLVVLIHLVVPVAAVAFVAWMLRVHNVSNKHTATIIAMAVAAMVLPHCRKCKKGVSVQIPFRLRMVL
ncbi:hypothetical protein KIPB_005992 [Kipferlia bialata]|uniref:Uncharacterized protein n=1 Tax=Kipferlia bialata TaxID=797122 RepID=A0A9K3GJF1_9EUKA|nr:hypothetical protein KIPB_005992 [Kipferlia bialata]|eukprot:g5992.t1